MKLKEIAELVEGEIAGNPELEISGVAGVEEAEEGDITLALDKKKLAKALGGKASCIMVSEPAPDTQKAQLIVNNPLYAFAILLGHFHKPEHGPVGVSRQAFVAEGVSIGEDAFVHPNAYVSEGVTLGRGTIICPGTFIGKGVSIGEECILYPNVVVREGVSVGNRVIIHPGAVVGADGFGYVPHEGRHFKIPQVGGVIIEDDVEIGAGTTIDRATTGNTVIGRGTKIDNLVQVGHNVRIGENCIIVALCGIGGSSRIGNNVVMGGQCGIADHAVIEDGTTLAARSGVMGLQKKGVFAGGPAIPFKDWLKSKGVFARLPELQKRVKELERRIDEIGGKKEEGK
jgi:UDP-3-O-[3-hydroxymyristoyl] glucosamine N-acyltransferase